MRPRARVFLDTSALFIAIWSESGGARMILKLGEVEAAQIVIGSRVLAELDIVLRRKNPAALGVLALLLDRCHVMVSRDMNEDILTCCISLTGYAGDAQVLAEAWCAGVDFFVTHDRKHQARNMAVVKKAPFPIGSPGDFFIWFRDHLLPITQ